MLHSHTSHSFSTPLAKRFNSVQAAVLVQHFYFWCKKNKENNKHFHDDHWWTYSTVKGLNEYFDYLPPNKIRGAIDLLKKEGLLIVGNYNSTPYDRTAWYALTEEGWNLFGESICENHKCNCGKENCICEKDNSKSDNDESKDEKHKYTDIKPDTQEDLNQIPKPGEGLFSKDSQGKGWQAQKVLEALDEAALKRVVDNAPGYDLDWLIEKYLGMIAKEGWPRSIKAAFPKWAGNYTKSHKKPQTPSSALASSFRFNKTERTSLENAALRIKALLEYFPGDWEKYFAGKPLEETANGWKITVSDPEAFQHEELLKQIKVKIEMV